MLNPLLQSAQRDHGYEALVSNLGVFQNKLVS